MRRSAKKILSIFAALMLIFCMSISAEAAKKVVAVMPLENVSGSNAENVAEIMTEQLIVAIQNGGQYTVVERLQMGAILREQGFQNIAVDPAQAVEIGKLLGANYSLIGKVTMASTTDNSAGNLLGALAKAGLSGDEIDGSAALGILAGMLNNSNAVTGHIDLDVRFVDNETGEIIFAKSFEGKSNAANTEAAFSGACKQAAENFLRELQISKPFSARIAEIYGEDVYIDQGFTSGLQKGEILTVAREGAPIVVNGKIVGVRTTAICLARVIEVNAEYSVCRVDNVGLIQKGDILKRR